MNVSFSGFITRFLNILVCFVMNYGYVYSRQSKIQECSALFEVFHSLLISIVTSSTYVQLALLRITSF